MNIAHPTCRMIRRRIAKRLLFVLPGLLSLQIALPAVAQNPNAAVAPTDYEPCADSALTSPPSGYSSTIRVRTVESKIYAPPNDNSIVIAAHRGYWRNAPEDSMTSIYEGIRNGVEVDEIDTFETQDDVPVLSHDDDLARTTTGKQMLISKTNYSGVESLYLRDRHGCPTVEHPVSLQTVITNLFSTGQVYLDDNDNLYGTVLAVDVKGVTSAAAYENLLDAITAWNNVANSDSAYSELAPAVIFKVSLSVMPQGTGGPAQFAKDVTDHSKGNTRQPMMDYIIYSSAYTDPDDPTIGAYLGVPYSQDAGTLGMETHERYLGDGSTAIRQYIQGLNRTVGSFSPDNFFPEGDPSGNVCCKLFNMKLTASPQPNCLSGGVGACLDERVRWDFLQAAGVGAVSFERPIDAVSYYSYRGRRGNPTPITSQPGAPVTPVPPE